MDRLVFQEAEPLHFAGAVVDIGWLARGKGRQAGEGGVRTPEIDVRMVRQVFL